MMVMPSNNSSGLVHYLAGVYPGMIGWLFSPGGFKEPRGWLPYAIDNGRYAAWDADEEWDEDAFFRLLDRCKLARYKPIWVAVPDEIGGCYETESLWHKYEYQMRKYGWPLAYVVQDGCLPDRVPKNADVVFVGGSTEWKWRNAHEFTSRFPRVHVGRVNSFDKLEYCERIGAESCDGTGFFRGGEDSDQSKQLVKFLSGHRHSEIAPELCLSK